MAAVRSKSKKIQKAQSSAQHPQYNEPCSECTHDSQIHPDHSEYLPRLKRIQGQIAGIERMISDQRYCVDILVQFRAVMAALRSIEVAMFETHLKHCVSSALLSRDQKEVDAKINELTELLARRTSL